MTIILLEVEAEATEAETEDHDENGDEELDEEGLQVATVQVVALDKEGRELQEEG